MINDWIHAGLVLGGIGLALAGIARLVSGDMPREHIIERGPVLPVVGPGPDPQTCDHHWETGVYLDRGRPNRYRGFACSKCTAIRWENGDITVDINRR